MIYWLDSTSSKTWVTSLGCFSDVLRQAEAARLRPNHRLVQRSKF
ncbi:hypothetical protein [Desmonostoc muscorum]|nr:hypothetical protein [Desmonostoc muscorum]